VVAIIAVLVNTIPYIMWVTMKWKRGDDQEEQKQAVDVPVKLAFKKLTEIDVAVKPCENTCSRVHYMMIVVMKMMVMVVMNMMVMMVVMMMMMVVVMMMVMVVMMMVMVVVMMMMMMMMMIMIFIIKMMTMVMLL
jgi:hypothetical protein